MEINLSYPLIVILGPTASGKTHLAVHLAHKINGEIISADSRQVYRGMDIGTGKDLDEYIVENQPIRYHLIDILEAGERYNVHRFQQDVETVLHEIKTRNHTAILCGGTGLYIEAVLKNHSFTAIPVNLSLREALEQKSTDELNHIFLNTPSVYSVLADTSTRKRLIRAIEIGYFLQQNPNFLPQSSTQRANIPIFGLTLPPEERRTRITQRLHQRLQKGMIEEVAQLLAKGISPDALIYYGLEYKFITQYLIGQLDYKNMATQLNVAIHQFAKRQMTFFRKMERDGLHIHWLDALQPTQMLIEEIGQKLPNLYL